MIDFIEIENFRSISQAGLSMRPLTVLIGPNGCGKSNFLDGLRLLAEGSIGELSDGIARRGGFKSIVFAGTKRGNLKVFFNLRFKPEGVFSEEDTPVVYKLQLVEEDFSTRVAYEHMLKEASPPDHPYHLNLMHRKSGECYFKSIISGEKEEESKRIEDDGEPAIYQVRDQTAYPTPYKLLRQLQEWAFYEPFDVSLGSPVRGPHLMRSGTRLAANGENLASVLYAIQQQHPETWVAIKEYLAAVYPSFRHITFPPEGGDGKILLRWWEEPFVDLGFSSNLLSDGTLRLLALISVLLSPAPPPLICIDEPETGLHPVWVKAVAEFLVTASQKTQVIVSTHSPELVSSVDPESVVVVEKDKEGGSIFQRLTKDELRSWLEKFSLGDLWLSGHLGGSV